MSTRVVLPSLGESVTEGIVTHWLKSIGDEVAVDEPLLEVSTDKVDTEVPSPIAGTLVEITVDENETVEVGAGLAFIAPRPLSGGAGQHVESRVDSPEPPLGIVPAAATAYVTPLIRKLAARHNVDLDSVRGTGPGGRIRKKDVLDAEAEATRAEVDTERPPIGVPSPASPTAENAAGTSTGPYRPRGRTEKLTSVRSATAHRMVESLRMSAQLTTVAEVDITSVLRLCEAEAVQLGDDTQLSHLPFVAKAALDALKANPSLNASINTERGEVTYHDREDLAIVVDTDSGSVAPVVKRAGDLSVVGLARQILHLTARARADDIDEAGQTGATFTLTDLGHRGTLLETPILDQPQVALLGIGAVVKRAMVMENDNYGETIAVRRMCYLVLTYDHRLVDGADAARFLGAVKRRLESGRFDL